MGSKVSPQNFPAKPVTYMAVGHGSFVTPNFKKTTRCYSWGVGKEKEMGGEVFPQNAV